MHHLEQDVPNALTKNAMKEAESDEDGGYVKVDSLESFIRSMD